MRTRGEFAAHVHFNDDYFPYTSGLTLLHIINMFCRRVTVITLFHAITMHLCIAVYIPPDQTTPASGTTGAVSSDLDHPPTTPRSTKKDYTASRMIHPIMDYIGDDGDSFYEYDTVNETTNNGEASGGNINEDEYCAFTLYVSQNSGDDGCNSKVLSSGDIRAQRGKGKVITGRPRSSEFLRRRLANVERRLDIVERQFYRQADTLEKLQNQVLGSEEGGFVVSVINIEEMFPNM